MIVYISLFILCCVGMQLIHQLPRQSFSLFFAVEMQSLHQAPRMTLSTPRMTLSTCFDVFITPHHIN